MQLSTIVILACLVAIAYAHIAPAYDTLNMINDEASIHQLEDASIHERSPRTKRGLFLLKKKLLLGFLGLKAVKAAKIGAVGVAGALALKKAKGASSSSSASSGGSLGGSYSYSSLYPDWHVSVRSWQ